MKLLLQFSIILFISCLGEGLAWIVPLPIPAAVYGMILMFLALCLKIVKLEHVDIAGKFLNETMVVMFTPPAVGLIAKWDVLKDIWPQVLFITVITTVIVMVVTGYTAQLVLKRNKSNEALTPKDVMNDKVVE